MWQLELRLERKQMICGPSYHMTVALVAKSKAERRREKVTGTSESSEGESVNQPGGLCDQDAGEAAPADLHGPRTTGQGPETAEDMVRPDST